MLAPLSLFDREIIPADPRVKERDVWRTPPRLVAHLEHVLGVRFGIDAAATQATSIAPVWIRDSLLDEWSDYAPPGSAVWCNYPYSHPDAWTTRAAQQARAAEVLVALLGPASTGAAWFFRSFQQASRILLLSGRVRFIPPPGIEEGSPRYDSAVIVFDGRRPLPQRCDIEVMPLPSHLSAGWR